MSSRRRNEHPAGGLDQDADATASARTERRLRMFESVVSSTTDFVMVTDTDVAGAGPQIVYVNDAFCRVTGYELAEVIGRTPRILQGEKTDPAELIRIRRALERHEPVRAELINYRKDGTEYWVDLDIFPVSGSGEPARLFCSVGRDLTERKLMEDELRANRALLAEAQRIARLGNWSWDPVRDQVWWSDEIFRIFGVTPGAFGHDVGSFLELVHPADRASIEEVVARALDRAEGYVVDFRVLHPSGEIRVLHTRCVVDVDEHGSVTRLSGTVQDITEPNRARQEIEATSKRLRALAAHMNRVREEERQQVARDLHDDLGQMLTALRMELSKLPQAWQAGDGIGEEDVDRMIGLTDSAIDVGRRIAMRLRPGLLDDLGLVAAAEHEAQTLEERSSIRCRVRALGPVDELGEPHATVLYRILQEALTNVLRHADARVVEVEIAASGGLVEMCVVDDGRGAALSEFQRPGAFGVLGMRERAAEIGGELEVVSRPGRGTTVRTTLPLAAAPA